MARSDEGALKADTGAEPSPMGDQWHGTTADPMILLLATLVVAVSACAPSPERPRRLLTAEQLQKARTLIAQSQAVGQIGEWSCVVNTAHVRPELWNGLDVTGKRGLAISFAAICEAENSGAYITIYDQQSGKQLAEFDGLRLTVD